MRYGIRGETELHWLVPDDFVFGSDEHGKYIQFNKRLSKNYHVSMARYKDKHFRPTMKLYEANLVETFKIYFRHPPIDSYFLFCPIIDNPRTIAWYARGRVLDKNLSGVMKVLHDEVGLPSEGITNKVGWASLVSRCQQEGVPLKVGMQIIGHRSEAAYLAYDRTKDAVVRAAQKCVSEGSNFGTNLQEETRKMKSQLIEGNWSKEANSEPPTKLLEPGKFLNSYFCFIAINFFPLFMYTHYFPFSRWGTGWRK